MYSCAICSVVSERHTELQSPACNVIGWTNLSAGNTLFKKFKFTFEIHEGMNCKASCWHTLLCMLALNKV